MLPLWAGCGAKKEEANQAPPPEAASEPMIDEPAEQPEVPRPQFQREQAEVAPQLAEPLDAPQLRRHAVAPNEQAEPWSLRQSTSDDSQHQQMMEQMAPPMQPMQAAPMMAQAESNFDVVEVFYGTDRASELSEGLIALELQPYIPAAISLGLAAVVALILLLMRQAQVAALAALAGVAIGGYLGYEGLIESQKHQRWQETGSLAFGRMLGELQVGVCQVSIPKTHKRGMLESPSILRMEFAEKPEDHVVLLETKSKEEEEFFELMRHRVEQSPNRDLLIFVHGYNVTFEDAARRTAQIAHDLKFRGAPVFFSWPSQGELFGYVSDRHNSIWTASHLKEFMLKIHQQSGARSINLIAHSMGNRAMGAAIRDLADDLGDDSKIFNQVILAAPDVDADVFRNEIAPRILALSNHVTLYASQNDLALKASRAVNGYPRAGDTGLGIMIVDGIDTVDVTDIDTSFVGHAYYGDNTSVISDIFALIHHAQFPHQRSWLRNVTSHNGPYWLFEKGQPASISQQGEGFSR
ncbi:MAG: alpha/beta hydrolase [Pirellulaceae bacterium]